MQHKTQHTQSTDRHNIRPRAQDKETLTLIYRQYIRSVLDYASPAWAPNISQTQQKRLQTTQNTALKIITGCTRTTPTQHIHAETQVLPVKEHLDMRGTQFIASATNNTEHPCHYMTQHPPTHRYIVNTPHRYYTDILESLPPIADPANSTKHIHTELTRRALAQPTHNTILNDTPPQISNTEKQLPRSDRVTLARLRCGHHPDLNTYKHRIDETHTDICPNCQASPHTVTHLLTECTSLAAPRQQHNIHSILQLWSDPVKVASYLRDAGFMA